MIRQTSDLNTIHRRDDCSLGKSLENTHDNRRDMSNNGGIHQRNHHDLSNNVSILESDRSSNSFNNQGSVINIVNQSQLRADKSFVNGKPPLGQRDHSANASRAETHASIQGRTQKSFRIHKISNKRQQPLNNNQIAQQSTQNSEGQGKSVKSPEKHKKFERVLVTGAFDFLSKNQNSRKGSSDRRSSFGTNEQMRISTNGSQAKFTVSTLRKTRRNSSQNTGGGSRQGSSSDENSQDVNLEGAGENQNNHTPIGDHHNRISIQNQEELNENHSGAPHFRGKRVSVIREGNPPNQQKKKPKAKGVQAISKRQKQNLPTSELLTI